MKERPLNAAFWSRKPLVGMVHLGPLPGSPRSNASSMSSVISRAVADAAALERGGADAIIVENFFDAPFAKERVPPHTVAAITRACLEIRRAVRLPLGVNVLRNDARSAIAIAHICDASFVRVNVWVGAAVTDQGIIEGAARDAILYRRELGADVSIWADVFVKHAAQLGTGSIADAARDAVLRGMADALIVSGAATGAAADLEHIRQVKEAVASVPVLIGSGFEAASAPELLANADGAIVGTSLKRGSDVAAPVDENRVAELRNSMNRANQSSN